MTPEQGNEFEIMRMVAELIDSLPQNKRQQLISMLLTRYECWPEQGRGLPRRRPFRPTPKQRS